MYCAGYEPSEGWSRAVWCGGGGLTSSYRRRQNYPLQLSDAIARVASQFASFEVQLESRLQLNRMALCGYQALRPYRGHLRELVPAG